MQVAVPPPNAAATPRTMLRRSWAGDRLAAAARQAAARAAEGSWDGLLVAQPSPEEPEALLVLLTYCYLAGVLASTDVPARLHDDEALAFLRPRVRPTPEDIRGYRRRHRRALNDSLTHALLLLAGVERTAGTAAAARLTFRRLEPFYLEARALIDRAVALDSMALDD